MRVDEETPSIGTVDAFVNANNFNPDWDTFVDFNTAQSKEGLHNDDLELIEQIKKTGGSEKWRGET